MAKWTIQNTMSGAVLGTFEADDEQGALEAMAKDAGYRSYAEACEAAPVSEGEIAVEAVETPASPDVIGWTEAWTRDAYHCHGALDVDLGAGAGADRVRALESETRETAPIVPESGLT